MLKECSGFKLVKNENGKYDLVYFKSKEKKEKIKLSTKENELVEKLMNFDPVSLNSKLLLKNYSKKQRVDEVAPPGEKYEKMILALKKKFGEKSPIPYKIAWKKYKEDHKKH